jgi:hypothetical protein
MHLRSLCVHSRSRLEFIIGNFLQNDQSAVFWSIHNDSVAFPLVISEPRWRDLGLVDDLAKLVRETATVGRGSTDPADL